MAQQDNTILLLAALGVGAYFLGNSIKKTTEGVGQGLSTAVQGTGQGISTAVQGVGSGIGQVGESVGEISGGLSGAFGLIDTFFQQQQEQLIRSNEINQDLLDELARAKIESKKERQEIVSEDLNNTLDLYGDSAVNIANTSSNITGIFSDLSSKGRQNFNNAFDYITSASSNFIRNIRNKAKENREEEKQTSPYLKTSAQSFLTKDFQTNLIAQKQIKEEKKAKTVNKKNSNNSARVINIVNKEGGVTVGDTKFRISEKTGLLVRV